MVYNYTKPRGPIAAMYSSPGPCYGLPGLVGQTTHDPRSVHVRGPAYAFGIRHGHQSDSCSPGPCYLPDSKTYRNGRDGTPHYSLYARNRDLAGFKTPGPGAYAPESAGPNGKRMPPAYSFGSRHHSRSTDRTPGPNAYAVPTMIGKTIQSNKRQSPSYTLSGRSKIGSFHEDLQKTPGPGTYTVTDPNRYKKQLPQYSMTSRNSMPGDGTSKPGPGAHSPERVWVHKRESPQFSFGIRHSQYTSPLIVEPKD
jgi:hypothetical protein